MQEPTDLAAIPSGMDNDPTADEQIIDQQQGETLPSPSSPLASDDLASSIAYALDGSGTGLPGSTPVVGTDPGKVITEGITGAGLADEEAAQP